MAKRRKEKDEDEDKAFKLPKFDEEKFIQKEKKKIKTTFLSFILGLIIAAASFGLWALMSGNDLRWPLILLFGVITGSWLKYFFVRLKIDISDFTKKDWFGAFMIYFFTWLVVLVVLVNPPFYDDEAPLVDLVVLPGMQEPGGDILIVAKITDNSDIEEQDILLSIDGIKISSDQFEYDDDILRYTYPSPKYDNLSVDDVHTVELSVKDTKGLETKKEGSFTYSYNAITVPEPLNINVPPGPIVGPLTTIKFGTGSNVNRLYYTLDGGKGINTTYDDEGYYKSFPKIIGWEKNKNSTMRVFAEVIYYFENVDEKFSNIISDTDEYYFNVSDIDGIGSEPAPSVSLPSKHTVSAPGFEILAFFVSLGAVVLIFKYSKRHRRN